MHYLAQRRTILHYSTPSCSIQHHPAQYGTIPHLPALSRAILHYLALSSTIWQHLASFLTIWHHCAQTTLCRVADSLWKRYVVSSGSFVRAVIRLPSSSINSTDFEHQRPLVATEIGTNRWVDVVLPYFVVVLAADFSALARLWSLSIGCEMRRRCWRLLRPMQVVFHATTGSESLHSVFPVYSWHSDWFFARRGQVFLTARQWCR